jgi:putative ABC transport system ATP-binding protein
MPIIRVKNLAKVYKEEDEETEVNALREINFEIEKGEFVAIIGPSGSGKSTLLQILGCLDRPTSGKYYLEDKELNSYSDDELAYVRNKEIGFVFQSFNLLPRLSVLENVEIPLVYSGVPKSQRITLAKEKISLVGLSDRENFKTFKLSGGQQQRVAIARALINSPKVILADEPTGNLDSVSGGIILKSLQDLNDEGHTIILVTHESFVAESARRIIHIKDGTIEKDVRVEKRRIISHDGFIK